MSSEYIVQAAGGVVLRDEAGNILFAYGTSVPTGAGYAKGCLFIDTDATGGSGADDVLFCNVGDATTANFDGVTIV